MWANDERFRSFMLADFQGGSASVRVSLCRQGSGAENMQCSSPWHGAASGRRSRAAHWPGQTLHQTLPFKEKPITILNFGAMLHSETEQEEEATDRRVKGWARSDSAVFGDSRWGLPKKSALQRQLGLLRVLYLPLQSWLLEAHDVCYFKTGTDVKASYFLLWS